MLCMQEGGRVKGCLRRHPFFPLYVLADRVDSPSRSNPLEAALKSLLPVKNKAFLEVGFFIFFLSPAKNPRGRRKLARSFPHVGGWPVSLFHCGRNEGCFGRNQGYLESTRWVV